MFRYTKIAILAVTLATGGAIAYAATTAQNDALAVHQAKITLSQAITAAEQRAGGTASRAEYERVKGGWAYDVEVVTGAKVFDVRVDANTGTAVSSIEDKTDHDDAHDRQD